MTNLTEKFIEHLRQLRESNQERTAKENVTDAHALSVLIAKEKGLEKGEAALVAAYIVDKGMSYEEALIEAMKDEE